MKIFLIGMMGAGKSYWAQKLAAAHGMDWIDLDAQVEKATQMSIAEIFETEGEDYFRNKEREVLQQLSVFDHLIIATGGGLPCFHDNMDWMNKNGITIWLYEPIEVLVKRLLPEKKHRPLIKDLSDEELSGFLSKRLAERKPFYSKAQHHLQGTISENSFSILNL